MGGNPPPQKVPVVLAVFEFSPIFVAKLLHVYPVPFPKPLCVYGGGGKWVEWMVFVGSYGGFGFCGHWPHGDYIRLVFVLR